MKSDKCSKFEGKTIIITGGGGDIGKAAAARFGAEGARIAVCDSDRHKAAMVVQDLQDSGIEAIDVEFDVSCAEEVEAGVAAIAGRFGQIDFLLNNAGYQGEFAMTHHYSPSDFAMVFQVNVIGAFHVLREVATHMVDNNTGAIVNVASMAGVHGPPNMIAYGASKSAVITMTETAAKDLAPFGIRVNSISPALIGPGFMWERQVKLQAAVGSQYFAENPTTVERAMLGNVPMRRYGSVQEVVGAVAFLLSDDASYVTGTNLIVAGGMT